MVARVIVPILLSLLASAAGPPALLLADDSKEPRVSVVWPTRGGGEIRLEGTLPYRSAGRQQRLGRNLDVYVALGGTRLERGLGHPDGATIRVGFSKREARRLLFDDLGDEAQITVVVDGIFMNQGVLPRLRTGLMHVQYATADLLSCGLGDEARNLYNTADAADPLLAGIPPENARAGILVIGGGGGERQGAISAEVLEDGSVRVMWVFPYALLKHIQDPYLRTNPGGFFEPQHFHLEIELLAESSTDEAGVAEARAALGRGETAGGR
jgi:hypothetical protein